MKNINFKTLMVATLFIVSMIYFPLMVLGQDEGDDVEESEQYGAFEGFHGGFGGIFSENLGYGGNIIGSLFEMLLLDGVDLEEHETIDHTYVLSASKEEIYEGSYDFEKEGDSMEIVYLPQTNDSGGTWNQYNTDGLNGYPYCEIEKEGGFDFNLTVGAALTLVVWDYDKSFIIAAQKVLDWADRFREAEKKDRVSRKLVAEGVQVLSWLLVNINEIFTGDELFVFNPIIWQTLKMDPWKEADHPGKQFNITKTWRQSGNGQLVPLSYLNQWDFQSDVLRDSQMQWLLRPFDEADLMETVWTQFSFDILQLWVKEFYIEIDLGEVADGGDIEDALEKADIEFYLFAHHLAGAFLYKDLIQPNQTEPDGVLSVQYQEARNDTTGEPLVVNGTTVMVPTSNEIRHRLILGTVEDFDFITPEIDEDDDSVSWGLQLNNANMSAVPVGVDLNSYLEAPQENLDYIYFGLEFSLEEEKPDKNGEIEIYSEVKLEHNFAPWNDGNGPNNLEVSNGSLDMAILYVSAIIHFDLKVRDGDLEEDNEDEMEGYKKESHTLKVGDYLDPDNEDKLDFVDIAGPGYYLGNNRSDSKLYTATTSIIPFALWEGTHESSGEYARDEDNEKDEDNPEDDFGGDVNAEAQVNILLYAVCYPDFNGTGQGIWHDPTFSVYMVFTPEEPEFWALILLIAGIGLAGVATVLIKRRKDSKFNA